MTSSRNETADDGSIALELAVIGPSLLFLIFFVLQAGLYFYGRSVALQSAREGLSQLRLAHSQTDFVQLRLGVKADVETFASDVGNGALDDPNMAATYDPASPDNPRVTVTVTGTTISLIPFASFHVSQTAAGNVEQFQAPP